MNQSLRAAGSRTVPRGRARGVRCRRAGASVGAEAIALESVRVAREAGLVYVTDSDPGIRRRRRGRGFTYLQADGERIDDDAVLARIRTIVIPPAWTEVWICASPRGHIQAVGRDARGRKQYRYHERWRAHRDEAKYQRLLEFGRALPEIRRRVARDLGRPGLPPEKVIAAIVQLLGRTLIRVGNDEYARSNDSYGLTTLLDDHVAFRRGTIKFNFRGKSGVERVLALEDPKLAKVVKRCQDIPGQTLFQAIGEDGERRRIDSGDVNDYLRDISGTDFTAKYFRTWGGTLSVMCELGAAPPPRSERQAKSQILEAIRHAAHLLGNTVSVCRSFYVHPAVFEAHREGWLREVTQGGAACRARGRTGCDLDSRERALIAVLRRANRARSAPKRAA